MFIAALGGIGAGCGAMVIGGCLGVGPLMMPANWLFGVIGVGGTSSACSTSLGVAPVVVDAFLVDF